jgi:penicillin-binding protein 1A
VIKFTSWFKDKSTKLTDAEISVETPAGEASTDESPDESQDEKPPQGKAKKLLIQAGKVPSAILSKLPGSPKPLYRRYWFWAGAILTGGFVGVTSTIASIDKSLPSASELNSVAREQTLTIKAADGTILQQSGPATREQLSVDETSLYCFRRSEIFEA